MITDMYMQDKKDVIKDFFNDYSICLTTDTFPFFIIYQKDNEGFIEVQGHCDPKNKIMHINRNLSTLLKCYCMMDDLEIEETLKKLSIQNFGTDYNFTIKDTEVIFVDL